MLGRHSFVSASSPVFGLQSGPIIKDAHSRTMKNLTRAGIQDNQHGISMELQDDQIFVTKYIKIHHEPGLLSHWTQHLQQCQSQESQESQESHSIIIIILYNVHFICSIIFSSNHPWIPQIPWPSMAIHGYPWLPRTDVDAPPSPPRPFQRGSGLAGTQVRPVELGKMGKTYYIHILFHMYVLHIYILYQKNTHDYCTL